MTNRRLFADSAQTEKIIFFTLWNAENGQNLTNQARLNTVHVQYMLELPWKLGL